LRKFAANFEDFAGVDYPRLSYYESLNETLVAGAGTEEQGEPVEPLYLRGLRRGRIGMRAGFIQILYFANTLRVSFSMQYRNNSRGILVITGLARSQKPVRTKSCGRAQ
jgi:hypothetical protein